MKARHSQTGNNGSAANLVAGRRGRAETSAARYYEEPSKRLPIRSVDVVVAGGGTAGVVAAIASARQGATTLVIEAKGYLGGTVVEGGTALHSFFNLWKAFPGVPKRQVVRGIPQEIIDRLMAAGGTSGHVEMTKGYDYDSVCTAIDTELYKVTAFDMLHEAGVVMAMNTLLTAAIRDGPRLRGVVTESRSGREAIYGKAFVDCTGYGDLAAGAGAQYVVPNDYAVCNSIGVGNVDVEQLVAYLDAHGSLDQYALGRRSGRDGQIVRIGGRALHLPHAFLEEARRIGLSLLTSTVHDNYLMFIKVNFKMPGSPTNRDDVAQAEVELRRRQVQVVELLKRFVPGCATAFIARTSPHLTVRRGRVITCDYDITRADVLEDRHFEDDVLAYGFHDSAPRLQIKDGGTYGIPYRALRVAGLDNLLVAGMMITTDHDAHMSTRNTVSCMGQGQAAGTAAALCAARNCGTRELPYPLLRRTLETDGVYFEP